MQTSVKKIIEQEKKKEAYEITNIIEKDEDREKVKNYYEESLYALIQYMKNNEKNPSESIWNKIAVENKYLSSKTIGFLSNVGFNTLCRKLRRGINKNKGQ